MAQASNDDDYDNGDEDDGDGDEDDDDGDEDDDNESNDDDSGNDDDDDSTACSSNRQSITANGPNSCRVPVIDTRERTVVKGTFT